MFGFTAEFLAAIYFFSKAGYSVPEDLTEKKIFSPYLACVILPVPFIRVLFRKLSLF